MEDISSIMARWTRFRPALWLVFLVLLTGCGGGPKFEGKWVGDAGLSQSPGAKDLPAHIAGAASKIEVEFLPSNRFRLVRLTLPTEGHYEVKDDKAYLHVETLLGAAVDPKSSDAKLNEGLTIEHKADGTLLMKDPLSFGNQEIVLKRAQPEA